jgi:hypothetical protein
VVITKQRSQSIEPWDIVDTWPLRANGLATTEAGIRNDSRSMGNKDDRLQERKRVCIIQEKLVDTLKKAQDENG